MDHEKDLGLNRRQRGVYYWSRQILAECSSLPGPVIFHRPEEGSLAAWLALLALGSRLALCLFSG